MEHKLSGDEPREVRLTITPGATPARDLPFGMVSDVCAVLEAYGLRVNAPELKGHGITEVIIALGRVVEVMPHFLGGRAGVERTDTEPTWTDTGSGPGYDPSDEAWAGRHVDSSTHTCPGCGVTVIGHERCGDPSRPACRGER